MKCKKYSLEERKNYVLEYKRSKSGIRQFCKEKGISTSALSRWLRETKNETKLKETFGKIDVFKSDEKLKKDKNNSDKIIVIKGRNVKIECNENINKDLLACIIGVFENVN